MVRRIASQVHHQMGRLMMADLVREPPVWYSCVLQHPPLPLPAKSRSPRTDYDTAVHTKPQLKNFAKTRKNMPMPIYYIEDEFRRQFFRDHPFEAFRPRTLVERDAIKVNPVQGLKWTRLVQRGRNPSSEDAIQFAANLHQYHQIPISHAYSRAVGQFRALRSEHHIALTVATIEARYLGGTFGTGEIQRGFEKEVEKLATWDKRLEVDPGALVARKRWRAIVPGHKDSADATKWTRGQEYVRLWKEDILPTYSAALTKPIGNVEMEEHDEMDLDLDAQEEEDGISEREEDEDEAAYQVFDEDEEDEDEEDEIEEERVIEYEENWGKSEHEETEEQHEDDGRR